MSIQKFLSTGFFIVAIAYAYVHSYAGSDASYYYKRALIQYTYGMYNYAVESLELTLSSDPKHFEAANLLGKIYLEHYNDRVRALQYFIESLTINDNQPDIHLEAGKLYYFFNEYSKAINHLQGTIAQKNDVYAHYYLVLIYNEQKNYEGAARHIALCNKITLQQTQPELEKAQAAQKENDSSAAVAHYTKVLKINPVNREAYIELAHCYRIQKKINMAIQILEDCKKVYPADTDVLLTLAHMYFEFKHPKRRDYFIKQAINLSKTAIAIDSSCCEAYSLLFEIYKELGEVPLRDEHAAKYDACLEGSR
ncbi:MAG: tetratricopeptide repeat protein [Spirochaetota bacterium]